MNGAGGKERDRVFPAMPPDGLVPGGYALKVFILWISFIGIFAGVAAIGGPFAVIFPLSLGLFLIDLVLVVLTRIKNKELWLYRKARAYYLGARYDMALEKMNDLLSLRPDMEKVLIKETIKCKILSGNTQEAWECYRRLFENLETVKEMDSETRTEIMIINSKRFSNREGLL